MNLEAIVVHLNKRNPRVRYHVNRTTVNKIANIVLVRDQLNGEGKTVKNLRQHPFLKSYRITGDAREDEERRQKAEARLLENIVFYALEISSLNGHTMKARAEHSNLETQTA